MKIIAFDYATGERLFELGRQWFSSPPNPLDLIVYDGWRVRVRRVEHHIADHVVNGGVYGRFETRIYVEDAPPSASDNPDKSFPVNETVSIGIDLDELCREPLMGDPAPRRPEHLGTWENPDSPHPPREAPDGIRPHFFTRRLLPSVDPVVNPNATLSDECFLCGQPKEHELHEPPVGESAAAKKTEPAQARQEVTIFGKPCVYCGFHGDYHSRGCSTRPRNRWEATCPCCGITGGGHLTGCPKGPSD